MGNLQFPPLFLLHIPETDQGVLFQRLYFGNWGPQKNQ